MYDDLKVGDVLMTFKQHGYGGRDGFMLREWLPRSVTKVTPKFFFIGDEKHAKSSIPGGLFGTKLWVPGSEYLGEVVPSQQTDPAVVEQFTGLLKRLYAAKHSSLQVSRVKELERRVYFAERYAELDAELKKELEEQGAY